MTAIGPTGALNASARGLRDWLAENPLGDGAFGQTLAGVARRASAVPEDFFPAVRELLDELNLMSSDEQRLVAIAEEPAASGDERRDACLAALAAAP